MINSKIAAIYVALVVFTTSSIFSQSKSVILYNSQPIKVELTDQGKIQSFIGLIPGYMAGYNLSTTPAMVSLEETEEPIISVSAKNAGYSVVSNEREELRYKPNFAILDKTLINKLDEIAARLKADPDTKVLLTAHTKSQEKNKLSTNRLASAIAYLGIKGIQSDRIQTDIQKNEGLIDVIAVNYLI